MKDESWTEQYTWLDIACQPIIHMHNLKKNISINTNVLKTSSYASICSCILEHGIVLLLAPFHCHRYRVQWHCTYSTGPFHYLCSTCVVTKLLTETPTSQIWYTIKLPYFWKLTDWIVTRYKVCFGMWLAILDDITGPFTVVISFN